MSVARRLRGLLAQGTVDHVSPAHQSDDPPPTNTNRCGRADQDQLEAKKSAVCVEANRWRAFPRSAVFHSPDRALPSPEEAAILECLTTWTPAWAMREWRARQLVRWALGHPAASETSTNNNISQQFRREIYGTPFRDTEGRCCER